MPVVQLLSSNASDPVDARLQTFGDIIDVDVSAVGRWLRRCARRSGCATCINCAAKFTPTRRYRPGYAAPAGEKSDGPRAHHKLQSLAEGTGHRQEQIMLCASAAV